MNAAKRTALESALLLSFKNTIGDLYAIVSNYDAEELPTKIPLGLSIEEFVRKVVSVSLDLGEELLESLVRSARRKRPGVPALAKAINDAWPFVHPITFEQVDSLLAALKEKEARPEQVRKAVKELDLAQNPPLWEARGAEELSDLIEGLSQMQSTPLPLYSVVKRLHDDGLPSLGKWLTELAKIISTAQREPQGNTQPQAPPALNDTPAHRPSSIKKGPMPGVDPSLHRKLKEALVQAEQLESDNSLRALFSVSILSPWKNSLPQAGNPSARAVALIAFLHDKCRADTKENVLALFLLALRDSLAPQDDRYSLFDTLAHEL